MRRITLIVSVVCLVALGAVMIPRGVSAQNATAVPAPIYNPYPPGILPADLNAELARVLGEVNLIEAQATTEWHALKPPTLTGQPPTLQDTGTAAVEIL